MALLDTLAELPIYVYPILFILLVIIVAAVSLFIGKRKYNQDNGIVKEKKVKAPKEPKKSREKTGKKLKRAEETAPASFTDEFDSDEDYDNAVESLRAAPISKPSQKVVDGPVIVVDENKVNPEEVIEWKPPTEDKKVIEAAPDVNEPVPAPVVVAPLDEPSESDWNDEDLELFEARAYSFDEETQSGYVSEKTPDKVDEKPIEAPAETVYAFREKKEPSRDPSEDEGVQVFETKDEKPEPVPVKPIAKEEPKVNNSKYAYFDSVMEKEKSQEQWQPPQERSAPASASSPSESGAPKKKSGMQYIELDLDDKE
ncbi:hypothetical protein [Methanimicrococcus blatticola]|uniref:Uncharacterized protein n=1 Tax=Methanimicrococcus blatticola TaxID=91560 RepID=A0A484F361_9EURY|nr:hypothetical protein [Methanimicrococcus blatticola]MBZ3935948.1 hypothetical protein [Methanimicrococcus blatticola]MCC2509439.1 hypothetical protein [Methanimicrococcus blatticola]TDQ68320.1 hypothetical protein C7391_1263 [Methanimicrococcus blatticola]